MIKTLVVASAHELHTLEAVYKAAADMKLEYLLVGDAERIKHLSDDLGYMPVSGSIIEAADEAECARKAVSAVRSLNSGVLVKGMMETATLLSMVLNKDDGIRDSQTLSHIAVLEVPGYHKLVSVTDGGMCINPTLSQKADIVRNAVKFYGGLGINGVKIAALSASEAVSSKIQESVDAAELVKMCGEGELGDCLLEGPLSFDIAVSGKAAGVKGFESRVSGDVDILLVPNIITGNILCKCLIHWGNAVMAGAVLGAKVPIVLASRGASTLEKLRSIAVCVGADLSSVQIST
ncbi:MAG: phosphate acyltransferase [Defluviitaleaceae bacterium]|nr:phosphate acyltransferase [Defluviitaleaceae bacterium]MCL2837006.1 phosphate acyltransferase [Defluviitaleaceae bacterium]